MVKQKGVILCCKSKEFGKIYFRKYLTNGRVKRVLYNLLQIEGIWKKVFQKLKVHWYVKWKKDCDTFAATGNGSLPLPSRRRAGLLRSLLDVRYVRIVEVQCERSGHRYGEAGGDHHRRGSSSRVSWILARPAVHAIAPSLLLSSASRPLWPPRPWTYITAHARRLMKTLLPGPYL